MTGQAFFCFSFLLFFFVILFKTNTLFKKTIEFLKIWGVVSFLRKKCQLFVLCQCCQLFGPWKKLQTLWYLYNRIWLSHSALSSLICVFCGLMCLCCISGLTTAVHWWHIGFFITACHCRWWSWYVRAGVLVYTVLVQISLQSVLWFLS